MQNHISFFDFLLPHILTNFYVYAEEHEFSLNLMNWIQKYFRIEGRSGFRRLSLFLASSHPGQNSHAFVVGIWYVVPQEQVRWNWILSNSSLESGTLQCWVAFYYWTLNVVGKELFFYGWTGGRSHVLSWELTRLSGCADGVQNVLWPDL